MKSTFRLNNENWNIKSNDRMKHEMVWPHPGTSICWSFIESNKYYYFTVRVTFLSLLSIYEVPES